MANAGAWDLVWTWTRLGALLCTGGEGQQGPKGTKNCGKLEEMGEGSRE